LKDDQQQRLQVGSGLHPRREGRDASERGVQEEEHGRGISRLA